MAILFPLCDLKQSEYTQFIGEEVLMKAPAFKTQKIGKGVLLCMDEDPQAWDTSAYLERQEAILDTIGREYFFDRRFPDRPPRPLTLVFPN